MANELRLRSNNISGAINDNPLLIGATTINSPSFADLPVVNTTNHLILILDPLELSGAAEIVKITTHSSSSTSVTVLRAQEGSTARQHSLGTTWFHGPVASDYGLTNSYADPWLNFTPVWTQGATITNTIQYARYTKDGRRVTFEWSLVATSAGTASNTQSLSIPHMTSSVIGTERMPMGQATFFDSSASTFYHCLVATVGSAPTVVFYPTASTGGIGGQFLGLSASGGTTAAVAVNDTIAGSITYEANS